jgi:hypothetical protein
VSKIGGRRVDFLQLTANCTFRRLRPGLIGFSHGDGVGVTRGTIADKSFIGFFGYVRAAHYDGNSRCANGIGHSIRSGHNPDHGADSNQSDSLVLDELRNLSLVHPLRIAIDQ